MTSVRAEVRPSVSVLMVAYDAEATIGTALASLVSQSFEDWECVVVDDGSQDATAELVARWGDRRFRLFRHAENQGRGAARQTGLLECRGEALTFLDADDWLYPSSLGDRWLQFRDNRGAVVSDPMAICGRSGELHGVLNGKVTSAGGRGLLFASTMLPTELARRAGFDRRLHRGEDVDMLARALAGREVHMGTNASYAYVIDSLYASSRVVGHAIEFRRGLRLRESSPLVATRVMAESAAKWVLGRMELRLGVKRGPRGMREPSEAEVARHRHAYASIGHALRQPVRQT